MAERQSFSWAQAEAVTRRLGQTIENIIPTRRGSAIVAVGREGRTVLKIADLTRKDTEQDIVPSRSEGIANEAMIIQDISHDIAPRLYAYEHDSQTRTVVSATEYVEGITLQSQPWHLEQIRRFMDIFLHTIARLHAQGIIHGDIQPHNIRWIPGSRRIHLIDFELSKRMRDSSSSVPGLYHFLSPDAAKQVLETGKCTVDIAEETFAAAATCLTLLKGSATPIEYPQQTTTRQERLWEIQCARYSECGVASDVITWARHLVRILLSPSQKRPRTPLELLDALRCHCDTSEPIA